MNKFKIVLIREDNKNLYFEIEKPTKALKEFLKNKDYVDIEIILEGFKSGSSIPN